MRINRRAANKCAAQTIRQMLDSDADSTIDDVTMRAFSDFCADYPAEAWRDEYVRAGGSPRADADAVRAAIYAAAQDIINARAFAAE